MARFAVVVSLLIAYCLCCTLVCPAQTDPIDEQGLKPFGSYHGGDIDVVNLMHGKLDLHAPVVSYPQRGGKLKMGFTLRYDNPIPFITEICTPTCIYQTTFFSKGVQVLPDFKMSLAGIVVNQKNVDSLVLADGSSHELGTTSGTVSESLDGTGWRYDSGADIATDREGTRYSGANTQPLVSMEDANGNMISATSSGWTDSVGRTIPNPPTAGTSNTTNYSGCTGSQQTTGAYNWVVPGPNGGTSTYKFCWASFSVSFTLGGQNFSNNPTWLQSLVLPNNQAWTFEYDSTGNLSTVTLPTGGTISYLWSTNSMCGATGYPERYYRSVTSRAVNANDGAGGHTWTYNLTNAPPVSATVTDPAGNYSVHSFSALAQCTFYETNETDYSSSGSILRWTNTAYSYSSDENSPSGAGNQANNVLEIEKDTYLATSGGGSQERIVKKTYDTGFTYVGVWGNGTVSYGNVLTEKDYDYGGTLLRTTNTQYVTPGNATYLGNNLLDLPTSVTTLDGNGNQVAYTSYGYDATSLSGGPYGQYRGNQTSVSHWLNTPAGTLTSSKTYNGTGTVASSTDPSGHVTSYTYDSTGTYVIQTNFPDTNSPNLAHHVTHALYDTNTGLLTSHTDENGNATTYGYDAMWRIQTVIYPTVGGKDTFTYNDTPSSLSVELQHTIDSSRSTNEYVNFDQLGREISRSKANDESVPWDKTDTCYDVRGLKTFVSYPYQSSSYNSGQVCSGAGDSYVYDGIKRTLSVTHSDGTSIVSAYSGAATSVTDEGNGTTATQKISQVDGLGRLISVCEVTSTTLSVGITPAPGSCGQTISATGFLTSYQYDGLSNLINVAQGGLTARSFSYDSVSRLLTAFNPESGTTSYSYDSDGNVITRTRPAPNQTNSGTTVTTSYTPDALHRTTTITYSDGTTPNSTFQYDQSSVSGQSPQNPIGRLTYETSANGTAGAVFSYDTMGRVLNEWECTPQNCGTSSFPVAFTYDYAGGLTSLNNGLGTTFSYALNREQRPTTVTSNYTQDGNPPTMFSALHYDGFGSELSASIGNGGSEVYGYDPRGRLESFTATAPGGVVDPATPGTGTVTVNGSEKSASNPATAGTGTVTITGSERNTIVNECPNAPTPPNPCNVTFYDEGYVKITVNGYAVEADYSQTLNTTAAAMASALTSLLNASGSPVTASLSGAVITLTAKATGTSSNYSLSASSATTETPTFSGSSYGAQPSGSTLTGGTNSSTTYDAGTVSITVDQSLKVSVSYGSGSTGTSLASALASALNGSLVTATASGDVVQITSVDTGEASNYTLSAASQSSNPSRFNPPSFTTSASGSTLTGGTNAHDTSGAAYNLSMGYSGNSNVISAQDSANGNWTYTYDPMNRLVTSACAGNSTAKCPDNAASQGYNYLYDRFGNRWQQNLTAGTGPAPQYSFDANNHMIGASYDAAGNMLNDGYHSYVYDAENRIIQVDGGSTATYIYDAEGRRVRKVAGSAVDYVYDHAGHELAEVNTSGSWTREEVYVGGRHLATYSGTTTYFHNSDWLGTERVRTDVNGAIYETCQSLPYGDGQACVGSEPSPMHFTGKQRDTETNLDDFPARYYSSVQGRWLSPDWDTKPVSVPYAILGNPQTLNLYSYVGGDPTNHADPDGHMNFCPECMEDASPDSSSEAGNQGSGQAGNLPTAAGTAAPPTAMEEINAVVQPLVQSAEGALSTAAATALDYAAGAVAAGAYLVSPGSGGGNNGNDTIQGVAEQHHNSGGDEPATATGGAGARQGGGTTETVVPRANPGKDGGISNHIIEKDASGKTISVTHQVHVNGQLVHQHQEHIGQYGTRRQFPDSWVKHPEVNQ